MRKKYPYSELFLSYSVRMRENTDQNNSQDGHFSRSDKFKLYCSYCLVFCVETISLGNNDLMQLLQKQPKEVFCKKRSS